MSNRANVVCSCCGTEHCFGQTSTQSSWEKAIEKLDDYVYFWLPSQKKWTRILILRQDPGDSPTIVCELLERELGDDDGARKPKKRSRSRQSMKRAQAKKAKVKADASEDLPTEWHSDTESVEEYQTHHGESNGNGNTQDSGNLDRSGSQHPAQPVPGEGGPATHSAGTTHRSGAGPSEGNTNAPTINGAAGSTLPATDSLHAQGTHHLDTHDNAKVTFEALSWCWGVSKTSHWICIYEDRTMYKKKVTRELYTALRALRWKNKNRYLWVDALCIDQEDLNERNHQVEIMSDIYGKANRVCIWLGEGDDSSKMALDFIRNEILKLQNFDALCESKDNTTKWNALLDLIQRPWFSRRWVVQELSLARKAAVYCGQERISWKKFAIAVELFVEVETATHRLSEVMQKDENFYHVPGWFEYVSMLGASLLVEATGKLFRDWKPNGVDENKNGVESDSDDRVLDLPQPSKTFNRGDPLLTLEYLVSSLAIFNVSNAHDAVYALLAISRDAKPIAVHQPTSSTAGQTVPETIQSNTNATSSSFAPTANSMVTSSIHTRREHQERVKEGPDFTTPEVQQQPEDTDPQHEAKKIVTRTFSAFTKQKEYKVDYTQPYSEACKEFVYFCIQNADPTRALDILCRPWAPEPPEKNDVNRADPLNTPDTESAHTGSNSTNTRRKKKNRSDPSHPANLIEQKDLPLPSWIAPLDGASHKMYYQPGSHMQRMGRRNADPLVGLPASVQNLQRNYAAAGTRTVDLNHVRFRRRAELSHYSMYVQGFVLDRIVEIGPASQSGGIPRKWVSESLANWKGCPGTDPPDEFWRTLVADRGRDGRNPPVYYSRACKESFNKGGLDSGSVNTTDLINNERNSVVAQFCRRVQAVIWNRKLIRTESGLLGLAPQHAEKGDLICILYGCSVPVVLHQREKNEDEVFREAKVDQSYLKKALALHLGNRWRKYAKWAKSHPDRYRMDKEARQAKVVERTSNAGESPKATWDPDRKEWISTAYEKKLQTWLEDLEKLQAPKRAAHEEKLRKRAEKKKRKAEKREARKQKIRFDNHASREFEGGSDRPEAPVSNAATHSVPQATDNSGVGPGISSSAASLTGVNGSEQNITGGLGAISQPEIGGGPSNDEQNNTGTVPPTSPRPTADADNTSEEAGEKEGENPRETGNGGQDDQGTVPPTSSPPTADTDKTREGIGGRDGENPTSDIPPHGVEDEERRNQMTSPGTSLSGAQKPSKVPYWVRIEKWLKEPHKQGIPKKKDGDYLSDLSETDISEESETDGSENDEYTELSKPARLTWEAIEWKPSCYSLIGECYLHGMMDGEALGYQNRKKIPTQTFELR